MGNRSLQIASAYMPSNARIDVNDMNNLVRQIPHPCFILCDFNSHGQLWGAQINDRRSQMLVSIFLYLELSTPNTVEMIRIAFRIASFNLSICSANIALQCTWDELDDPNGSDHLSILVKYNNNPNNTLSHHHQTQT